MSALTRSPGSHSQKDLEAGGKWRCSRDFLGSLWKRKKFFSYGYCLSHSYLTPTCCFLVHVALLVETPWRSAECFRAIYYCTRTYVFILVSSDENVNIIILRTGLLSTEIENINSKGLIYGITGMRWRKGIQGQNSCFKG